MIERYDGPEAAIPHETTVLVVNETDTCFEKRASELLEPVRSGLTCDEHLVEVHSLGLDDLPEYDTLIQYQVWVVHHSCLLVEQSSPLATHLKTESVPDETQVVVVLDTDDANMAEYMRRQIEEEYSEAVTVVSSETALTYFLLGHLETATPCSVAGLDYLVSWNNKVADNVGPQRDLE